jgi:SAM-dependent methyltransferase
VSSKHFPTGFFGRADEFDDAIFYEPLRMVAHIDDGAIGAVTSLYDELKINGRVLDLMGSWISHFDAPPAELSVLGMNLTELQANPMASSVHTHDLNVSPALPFADHHFDDVVCAVSVDYLTRPVEVFAEVCRVLKPGGRFVCTFSNRCFPTKAIRGWLIATEHQRCEIVAKYFELADGYTPAVTENRTGTVPGDPLYAVWATKN